jgi:PAS domain S-box-containing protein
MPSTKGWFQRLKRDPIGKQHTMKENPAGFNLEDFMELTNDAIVAIDRQHNIILFSPSAERIFGFQVEEILGQPLDLLIPPRYRQTHRKHIQVFDASSDMKRLMAERQEILALRKDGTEFPAEASIAKLERDGIIAYAVFLRDITRQKQIEQSLRKWAQAFENAEWGIVIGQAGDTTLELMNPAFARLYGYTVPELTGKPIAAVYAPEDRPRLASWIQQAHEIGHITYEARHLRKDGSTFQALVDITAVKDNEGDVLYRVVNVQDISERKRIADELRSREAILQSVTFAAENYLHKEKGWEESILDVLGGLGQAARVSRVYLFEGHLGGKGDWHVSQRYEWAAPGVPAQIDNPDLQNFPLKDSGFARWETTLLQGQPIYGLVRDFPEPEKALLAEQDILSMVVVPVYCGDRWWGFLGFDDCTSERFWSEAEIGALKTAANILGSSIHHSQLVSALRESELKYHSVFESTQDGLFINTFAGNLVDFNPAAAAMHGYTIQEFRQLQPEQFIHPDSYQVFQEYLNRVKTDGYFRGQAVDVCKDGSLINVEVQGTVFIYQDEPHTLAVVRDITEVVQAYQLLEKRVESRTAELSALLEVSRNVASNLDLSSLFKLILTQLKTVIDYTGAGIAVLEGNDFILLEYLGPVEVAQMGNLRFPVSKSGGYLEVINRRAPYIIEDIWGQDDRIRESQDHFKDHMRTHFQHTHAWIGLPLIVNDKLIGVLRLDHEQPGYFTDSHARLAIGFAEMAAVAIENDRLNQQAQALGALKERQKLARELHDSISQSLYGIALGVRTARTLLDRDPAKAVEPLDYCLNLADASLADMRALIFELRPESLEMEGIIAAIRKHIDALQARYGLEVQTVLCDEPPIPVQTKEALYRIAQEALQNIIKHASATAVRIFMDCSNDQIELEVCDNGRGFDSDATFPGHLGLKSMRERAEQVGGSFFVDSKPGSGTCLRVQVPNNPAANPAFIPGRAS